MYSSALYTNAHSTLENCRGLRQLFEILPKGVELSINLENRIYATLTCHEKHLKLEPRKSSRADIEVLLFSESIRRLSQNSPEDITSLASAFAELVPVGHARLQLLSPATELYKKGYLEALKGLGPEIQNDLTKYSFLLMGKLSQAADTLKTMLKR